MKITKRKDGRYACNLTIDRKRVYIYGATEDECKKKALQLKSDSELAPLIHERLTLKEYCNSWLSRKEADVTPVTMQSYIRIIKVHILPLLGKLYLQDLKKHHVAKLVESMQDNQKSPRTIQYTISLFSNICKTAKIDGYIKINPCEGVKKPKLTKKRARSLDKEQAQLLLDYVKNELHHDLIYIALYTGLRREELLGLTISSIDEEAKTLTVNGTVVIIGYVATYTKNVKTESSYRTIAVDDSTLAILSKWKDKAIKARHNLLFCHQEGGQPYNPNFVSNFFRKYARALNFNASITFHSLRHTHATLLLENGVHHKVIQSRLGHATFTTTMDIYSHTSKNLDESAITKLSKYMQNK